MTGHEARSGRGKKHDRRCDFGGCGKPLHRRVGDPTRMQMRDGHGHLGGGISGADGIDRDLVSRPFAGKGTCQLDNSGFGGVVGTLSLRAIDDAA